MNAATPPINFPRERGSPVYQGPLASEGPAQFYPPVCLQSHWDPTAILRHTLPAGYVPQPLDPRPWTKVCMQYTTAGDNEPAPAVNNAIVLPSGGQFYPPGKYQAAIDQESQLRRMDRPLGTCEANQWEPSLRSDMFDARILVPRNTIPSDPSRIQEVAFPKALLRAGPYDCREQADRYNMLTSSDYLFNNATKQDRYKAMKKATKPAAPEFPLKGVDPQSMRPDLDLKGSPPSYAPGSYEKQTAFERADLVNTATAPKPREPYLLKPPVETLPFAPSLRPPVPS